ncbi:DUF2268 domain-containing putative Zn-dependent protease [Halomonas eurihalina]|nr:DUF2268 domain-containing putative Zn-dependent protease [Halomonas eurihalina]MDR5859382.1 DUF2268 domain-containing putative Zn-dependent protease [Halomonas eurihalina]
MTQWIVHYANACGQLDDWLDRIDKGISAARHRAERVSTAINLDIVVQVWPGRVIDIMGFAGYAPTGTMMQLTLDPGNENFARNMGEPFERMVAHELHHVMRWQGPGYGETLGEALVSEGLAGHFSRQLYGSAPEPWERALSTAELAICEKEAQRYWNTSNYCHGAWFFGQGDQPPWAGYSLGYALIGRYLECHDGESPTSLAHEPAERFRTHLSRSP